MNMEWTLWNRRLSCASISVSFFLFLSSEMSMTLTCPCYHLEKCAWIWMNMKRTTWNRLGKERLEIDNLRVRIQLCLLRCTWDWSVSCAPQKRQTDLRKSVVYFKLSITVSSLSLLRVECYSTHCNTLQHTATRCNTLQHAATHCNTLQHTALHVECRSIKSSNLNLIGLFSTEHGKRDVEN